MRLEIVKQIFGNVAINGASKRRPVLIVQRHDFVDRY